VHGFICSFGWDRRAREGGYLCDDGRNAVAQIEMGCGVGGVDRYKFDVHGFKLFDLPVE